MKRLGSLLLTVVTMLCSWWLYSTVYGYTHPVPQTDPGTAAVLMLGIILWHEFGHLLMFELYGLRATIVFLFIVDAAMVWPSHAERTRYLPLSQYANIVLAGLVGNLVYVAYLSVWWMLGFITSAQLQWVSQITVFLIIANLLPLGPTDGGQFMEVLLLSVPKDEVEVVYMRIWLTMTSLYFLLGTFWSSWAYAVGGLFVFGLQLKLYKFRRGKIKHHEFAPKMNYKEREEALLVYFGILLLALVLIAALDHKLFVTI